MTRDLHYWRFWLARLLMNAGLLVMPPGRCRTELTQLLWMWRMKVDATVAAYRAAGEERG